MGRLSATLVNNTKRPGRYGDGRGGHGLSLLVKQKKHGGLSKSWSQRVYFNGKPVSIGLGAYPAVTLQLARKMALEKIQIVKAGGDPRNRPSNVPTFAQAAEKLIASRQWDWRPGGRTEKLWRASLNKYAMKKLGHKPVDAITTFDVSDVVEPLRIPLESKH